MKIKQIIISICCVLLLTIACSKSELKPGPISSDDMCAFCKMTISEQKFASEFIVVDHEPVKFDELGCMKNYLKQHPEESPAAYFAMDYQTRQWIEAERAFYVHSSNLQTPMGGGIVAFTNRKDANEEMKRSNGELWTFQQYLQSPNMN